MKRFGLIMALLAAAALGVAVIIWFASTMPVQRVQPEVELAGGIDFGRLFDSISTKRIKKTHEKITSASTRLAGTEGDLEASRFIEREFRRLGLRVIVQTYPVSVPVTKKCEISLEDGSPAAGVQIAPFWPNHVRTCTTPPGGIVGQVIEAGTGSLAELKGLDVRGKIVLLDMTPTDEWLGAANLGASAILFRKSSEPSDYRNKILKFPGNMPRFLVEGSADQLIGKRVRLEARVDWQILEARNVYGVLKPPQASGEAVVLMGHTDSWSVVPDQSPGYYEACSATALLESARALAAQRDGVARKVIFVAASGGQMGIEGSRRMLDVLGVADRFEENFSLLERRLAEAQRADDAMSGAVAASAQTNYWKLEAADEDAVWQRYGEQARQAFDDVVEALVDRHVALMNQRYTAKKMAWVQAGRPDSGRAMDEQLAASHVLRRARSAAGTGGQLLKRFFPDVLEASGIRNSFKPALADAQRFARNELTYEQSAVEVARLFAPLKRFYIFHLAPSTHGRTIRYQDYFTLGRTLERVRDTLVNRWLDWCDQGDVPANETTDRPPPGRFMINAGSSQGMFMFPAEKDHKAILWHQMYSYWIASRPMFLMVGVHQPPGYQCPLDTQVNYPDLAAQTQLMTAFFAQAAAGKSGGIPILGADASPWTRRDHMSDLGGEVVTADGSNAILPDRRVQNAIVVLRDSIGRLVHIQKTRNGVFRFPATAGEQFVDVYSIDEETGELTGARNMGPEGQKHLNMNDAYHGQRHFAHLQTRITVLMSRMAPVDVYQLLGPHDQPVTLQLLDADFGGPLGEYSQTHDWEHGATFFVRSGQRFFVRLNNYPHYRSYGYELYEGTFGKEGRFAKGLLSGMKPPALLAEASSESEYSAVHWGAGYLAGVDRRIVAQDADLAMTMAAINRGRLAGQIRAGLADPVDRELADKADQHLGDGLDALRSADYERARRQLSASAALSLRVYPDIRAAVADSVSGILLYMFLLVPFSLFMERLLFGARDMRARIAGVFAVFIVAFEIIRRTHPAYDLISSPMIVLVGFVIFMLCLLILSFISGKFVQRIGQLRRISGGATEADSDISRAAATATAFNLGINNMRKRKVRTALTATTLVMVSFCLVCFTAPQSQLLRRQVAMGTNDYEGVMLRFDRQLAGHLPHVRTRYGNRATVIGRQSRPLWDLVASYTPPGGTPRSSAQRGILYLQSAESKATGIDRLLLPGGRWFARDDEHVCYLSDMTAAQLGIDPARVGQPGKPPLEILVAGWPVPVAGIFDSSALGALRDFDGESLMPENEGRFGAQKRAEQRTRRTAGGLAAGDGVVSHLDAAKMILAPLHSPLRTDDNELCTSFVLRFEDQPYGVVRETINEIMDRAPTFISYALDGLAYFGGNFRMVGLEALVDVIVPLLIGAFIVFNTMLGSVYERQKEIAVFSAVGLSPRHVFYLFLAESLVYAVIGVVGGYLLALGLQWFSHQNDDLLGLNINYSSRSAIYVTITLMAAVIVSSFVPAMRAARIASPTERVSWTLPEATQPGRLEFDLPFTYMGREIMAVVPFISGFFDARGEDSSGEFSASPPKLTVRGEAMRPIFTISADVWLRPYDLGVSQHVQISITPPDEDAVAQVYIALVRLDLLSGDETSWRRTNTHFVALLRRHLLIWRAVSTRRKQMFFDTLAQDLGQSHAEPA